MGENLVTSTGGRRNSHNHWFSFGGQAKYGGLRTNQAKRFKELERENARLKKLVADLSLDKETLRDVARGNF